MSESDAIMIRRRLPRSTNVPAIGPSRICGSIANREAVASTVAEPVFCVKYQISANCTSEEPKREMVWPVKMVKKRTAQCWGGD